VLTDVGEGLMSRWLSSLVAAVYIVLALVAGDPLAIVEMAAYCLFALCCVWSPYAMNSSPVRAIGRNARKPPATMVWFVGWSFLLLPMFVLFLLWAQGVNPLTMDLRTG
jgi:hypothetical protein